MEEGFSMKIKLFFRKNLKLFIGIIISGTTVYAATIIFNSNQVAYDNTRSEMSVTNVQDALDELYTKANTLIDPSYIDFTTLATNTKKTVLASKNGVCIKRNNKVSCFKINNWAEEQNHIQQVFSDISCYVDSSRVSCSASDFGCDVFSGGGVSCGDFSDYSSCVVGEGGSINCN